MKRGKRGTWEMERNCHWRSEQTTRVVRLLFQLLKVAVCGGQGQTGWIGMVPLWLRSCSGIVSDIRERISRTKAIDIILAL